MNGPAQSSLVTPLAWPHLLLAQGLPWLLSVGLWGLFQSIWLSLLCDVVADEVRALSSRSTVFSTQVPQHVDAVHTELKAADAAVSLLAAKDMSFALGSRKQVNEMLDDLQHMSGCTLQIIAELDAISRSIGDGINSAVTALQFQDLSSQLLAQMQGHCSGLEVFSPRLQGHSRLPAAEQVQRLQEERLQFNRLQSGPVSQTSMNAGGIDLF